MLYAGQLLLRAEMKYFAPQVCIADAREEANYILIIVSGQVEVSLPVKDGGGLLLTLKRGYVSSHFFCTH